MLVGAATELRPSCLRIYCQLSDAFALLIPPIDFSQLSALQINCATHSAYSCFSIVSSLPNLYKLFSAQNLFRHVCLSCRQFFHYCHLFFPFVKLSVAGAVRGLAIQKQQMISLRHRWIDYSCAFTLKSQRRVFAPTPTSVLSPLIQEAAAFWESTLLHGTICRDPSNKQS